MGCHAAHFLFGWTPYVACLLALCYTGRTPRLLIHIRWRAFRAHPAQQAVWSHVPGGI